MDVLEESQERHSFELSYPCSVPDMRPELELSRVCPLSSTGNASRPATLLSLPPYLRHFIYLHLDVARLDGYPYTYYLAGHKNSPGRSERDAPPSRNFLGLLLSCRVLYTEVASLLYSANRFIIFYTYQRTLRPLRALSPTSIAALTNLKIVLNESSCHNPINAGDYAPDCCSDRPMSRIVCAEHHGGLHRRPLLDSLSDSAPTATRQATQAMLTEWHHTATYLSSHATTGRFELWLVCDIDPTHEYALEAAQRIVAPLALFPPLKDCHIRLAGLPNRPLQQVAEEAILPTRPNSPSRSPLLTNLPPELRLRILEYTDLITPWKEVTWCRRNRSYYIFAPPCLQGVGGCPPHIHHGCPLAKCTHDQDCPPGPETRRSHGCFCRRLHGAYTSTCKCWAPPTPLFLINRLLCHDAQTVFFSNNRFVIHDFYDLPPESLHQTTPNKHLHNPRKPFDPVPTTNPPTNNRSYPHTRYAASEFLRAIIPPPCLRHLRFLEILFPPYVPNDWPLDRRALQRDWRDTVAWARSQLTLSALAVRVVMSYPLVHPDLAQDGLTSEEGEGILRGYWRAARPWREMMVVDGEGAGLAGFWVQAAWPFRGTQNSVYRAGPVDFDDEMAEREVALKAQFERAPGWDGGGEVYNTRPEPMQAVWQRWYDVDYY